MSRRLNKMETDVLFVASRFPSFRPSTVKAANACRVLTAHELLLENDNAPGVYTITTAGELALEKTLALKKAS